MIKIRYLCMLLSITSFLAVSGERTGCKSADYLWEQTLLIESYKEIETPLELHHILVSDPKPRAFTNFFHNCIKPHYDEFKIKSLSKEDQHKFYLVLRKLTFYSQNKEALGLFRVFLDTLQSAGPLNISKYASTLHERYITNWMFIEAIALEEKYDLVKSIYRFSPKESKSNQRQIIVPTKELQFTLKNLDFKRQCPYNCYWLSFLCLF